MTLTDYTQITAERALDVVNEAIDNAEALLGSVIAVADSRTYENTLAPIDRAFVLLNDAFGVGGFMSQVHPDEEVRSAGAAAEEKYGKWLAGLAFRRDLYEAIKDYSQTDDAAALVGERQRNLEYWLRDFRRAGQDLPAAERDEIEELRNKLIEINVAFERNLSEWDDGIDVTAEQLAGLPDSYVERLAKGKREGESRVTVTYPDYVPFMDQAQNRPLRQWLQFKFMNRAATANIRLLNEAVELRWQIARKLGYSTFAEYAMETKMADPKAVDDFYGSIVPGLKALATAELEALQALMEEDLPGEEIQPWDWAYYDSAQRKRDYGVDDNEVAEYFPLETAVQGMFDICGDMFSIDFEEVEDPKAWHEDVSVYAISDRVTGDVIAHYYADLHPRPGKFSHAACWRLRAGVEQDGAYRRPIAAVAANFTKPTAGSPSLLKHDEAVTLFHEFGHVLHNTLTEVKLPRFSGTATERDFVEAPSQIMENWMWEPEVLSRFARHYKTADPIPDELIINMVAARDQNVALKTLRQVFYGHYDMALHAGDGPSDAHDAYYDLADLTMFPPHEGTNFGASFGHMANDGYVAGYYGYLWSKVYGDDMFSLFEAEGVLNPDVGMRYRREILAKGGTIDGMDLLRNFLGREPNSEAFLSKIGLG
ncbi:MAG: Zn-dependent oligopeptidase [Acidimicrobiia bacterium]|nr:Zn-dependent oligopeptidase [Acidimicrobiia bacterium]